MAKEIKKYELGVPFCAERLMLIQGAMDAANKPGLAMDAVEALTRLANLWALDLVDGVFVEEPPDNNLTESDLEDAMFGEEPKTITQIAKKLDAHPKGIRKVLLALVKGGKVAVDGEHRSRTYEWKEKKFETVN